MGHCSTSRLVSCGHLMKTGHTPGCHWLLLPCHLWHTCPRLLTHVLHNRVLLLQEYQIQILFAYYLLKFIFSLKFFLTFIEIKQLDDNNLKNLLPWPWPAFLLNQSINNWFANANNNNRKIRQTVYESNWLTLNNHTGMTFEFYWLNTMCGRVHMEQI